MSLPREGNCLHCGAKVIWHFARPEDPCLECGLPVGQKEVFDPKMERVNAVVKLGNRAAHIIADEIHKSVSRAVTAGTEHALEEMRQMPELEGFDTTKVINILRRDVCWRLADLAKGAAEGWDDLVFNRAIRFEPPNPDDPHGGDDPHGHQ